VTEAQFHRLLDLTLQRQFSLEEVQLLTEYYRSPTSGDINYHAFLADIDSGLFSPLGIFNPFSHLPV
jgi:hypothetical protein